MLAVFALLDLPFSSNDHGFIKHDNGNVEIKAASNLFIFKKERIESGQIQNQNDVILGVIFKKGKNMDAVEEFEINEVYICRVDVTNISEKEQKLQVLTQIPEGSIPINCPYDKSYIVTLEKYASCTFLFRFYFPTPGKFNMYPPTVSREHFTICKASPLQFNVLQSKTAINKKDFIDVMKYGSQNDILDFIKKEKPHPDVSKFNFTYDSIYFMLKKQEFYSPLVQILRENRFFNEIIWEHSFLHMDEKAISELLDSSSYFRSYLPFYCNTQILKTTKAPTISDFFPLLNPRAHAFSEFKSTLKNRSFRQKYLEFLEYLMWKPNLSEQDFLTLAFYLLLSDNIPLAKHFLTKTKLNPSVEASPSSQEPVEQAEETKEITETSPSFIPRLQFDYLFSYTTIFSEALNLQEQAQLTKALQSLQEADAQNENAIQKAQAELEAAESESGISVSALRLIVDKYKDYPVLGWRILFEEIGEVLDLIEGIERTQEQKPVRKPRAGRRKNVNVNQPVLSMNVENDKKVIVDCRNVKSVEVLYYYIDLEIMFSNNPFMFQQEQYNSFVKPDFVQQKDVLENESSTLEFELPQEVKGKNVVVEAKAQEIRCFHRIYSSNMVIQISQNYGEIKVMDSEKNSLIHVYVKVFAQTYDYQISFYKDGYTDIRGIFDYLHSSLDNVEKFAIFIMSQSHGIISIF
jgi:hypothetical protein